jgi:hypothetical protein
VAPEEIGVAMDLDVLDFEIVVTCEFAEAISRGSLVVTVVADEGVANSCQWDSAPRIRIPGGWRRL